MSLRYKFHHLFFDGKVNKKRLYEVLKDLDEANGGETTDINAIKSAIGKSTSGSETGFYKDIKDINTAIGVATSGSETGIHKDIVDINTVIGDASDPAEGTILYRLAELEKE